MDTSLINVWDPINDNINLQTYAVSQQALANKLQTYRTHPILLKLYLFLCCLVPIATLVFFILFPFDIRILVIGFIPPFVYFAYIMHLQEELILYLLCEKNHWPYSPMRDDERARDFSLVLPQVFDLGHSQRLDEQIWGSAKYSQGSSNFWSGEFKYVTGSGKSSQTHMEYIFIFQLPKPISTNFTLAKTGLLSIFEEQIKTESEAFNKTFQIIARDNNPETKQQIIKLLSPSVQTRLLDFSARYKTNKIVFQYNMMVIILSQKLWSTHFTNLFRNVAIDTRDEESFYASLSEMAELPTEMIQFIG